MLMFKLLGFVVTLLITWLVSAVAAPEVTPYFTTASGWQVFYHNGSGNCGMVRNHALGTEVIVTFDRSNDTWTFSLSNQKWDLVKNGQKYNVYMKLDGVDTWKGQFTGSVFNGRPIISLPNTKVEFIKKFMEGEKMTIGTPDSGDMTTLNLDGSWDAMLRVAECQKAHQS